ncbi:uncharacterized protein YbjT (DUF2867 family) [Parabacteroides sp. PFB2-10]|uniref:hypothetical protein n=1 Tax=Parabacteroides sp. PFB2-10 TaxID=1742405 RepID=UPI00247504DC|nr:hypothetical protein [Parabacteroides sp. PFB2-10]MDH6313557.1 uncharacterized protein YbjT (DUF2867 family) [Parabacteroides sp. PFB2-10]MDL2245914.1 hypothetical protein [Parabacteroides sp. OttesenSCG-928-J18]
MNIITGASGKVGSALVKELGNFEHEQKIPMVSPQDIAKFIASVFMKPTFTEKIIELMLLWQAEHI